MLLISLIFVHQLLAEVYLGFSLEQSQLLKKNKTRESATKPSPLPPIGRGPTKIQTLRTSKLTASPTTKEENVTKKVDGVIGGIRNIDEIKPNRDFEGRQRKNQYLVVYIIIGVIAVVLLIAVVVTTVTIIVLRKKSK
ncbi:hypothetical protein RB195_020411 [Necator americanus]|uniref:Uncharacterized protein n=1 Tax=Necator americanus TaxID=51031 RepID=A0ABR1CMA4_NECAM